MTARILAIVAMVGCVVAAGTAGVWQHLAGAQTYSATTTLSISVCGDAIVQQNEVCDDGTNSGAYASSTANRNCKPLCDGFAPYCGDSILHTLFGEECDDGNNTSGDLCSATCQQEEDPVAEDPGGSGGGSTSGGGDPDGSPDGTIDLDEPTRVVIEGKAYPNATVSILLDGVEEEVVEADSGADFDHTFTSLTPGVATFGFRAEDDAGRNSITFSSTFEVVEGAITTLSGLYIPPTIAVEPDKLPQGDQLSVLGQAIPGATMYVHVDDDDHVATTTSNDAGLWDLLFDTSPLGNEEFHTVKARYEDPADNQIETGFSTILNFYVGVEEVAAPGSADLNSDGGVNLTDFSILLFNWGTSGPIGDLNQDGTVNLQDFSILLFAWTG